MTLKKVCSKIIGCFQKIFKVRDSGDLLPSDTWVQSKEMPNGFVGVTAVELQKLLQMLSVVDLPKVADVYDVSELPNDGQSTALQRMVSALRSTSPIKMRKIDAGIPRTDFGIGMVDAGYNLSFVISENFLQKLARSRAMVELGIWTELTMTEITNAEMFAGPLTKRIVGIG